MINYRLNNAISSGLSRHGHVETSKRTANSRMSTEPVRHNKPLEPELALENVVHEIAILACLGVVDLQKFVSGGLAVRSLYILDCTST